MVVDRSAILVISDRYWVINFFSTVDCLILEIWEDPLAHEKRDVGVQTLVSLRDENKIWTVIREFVQLFCNIIFITRERDKFKFFPEETEDF